MVAKIYKTPSVNQILLKLQKWCRKITRQKNTYQLKKRSHSLRNRRGLIEDPKILVLGYDERIRHINQSKKYVILFPDIRSTKYRVHLIIIDIKDEK